MRLEWGQKRNNLLIVVRHFVLGNINNKMLVPKNFFDDEV